MGIFFSFKKPTIRQFNYTPRYYDPQKEEMKERRERVAKELQRKKEGEVRKGDSDEYSPSLRQGFLREKRNVKSATNGGVWGKAIVISVAVLAAYLMFNKL